jgi:hypothetical protein
MRTLLSPAQVAERLGVSPEELTAWRWQRRGPQFVRHAGAIAYTEEAIAAWLKSHR